jgi:hypothetical protein
MTFTPKRPPVVEAVPMSPMEVQLEKAREFQKNHPDRAARMVNTSRREISDLRIQQGYEPVGGAEAWQIGELRLMSAPKEKVEERRQAARDLAKRRAGSFQKDLKRELSELGVPMISDEEV